MKEQEWLACGDPKRMLHVLFGEECQEDGKITPLRIKGSVRHRPSNRKQLLFCCACCRQIWPLLKDDRSRQAVVVAEQFADGKASEEELRQANLLARNAWLDLSDSEFGWPAYLAWGNNPFHMVNERYRVIAHPNLVNFLRDVFGNPFHPWPPTGRKAAILYQKELASWLAWNDGTVVKIAHSIYNDRVFNQLPILADALEEASCTSADILNHSRQPGEHVRGCWVIDLILGKV